MISSGLGPSVGKPIIERAREARCILEVEG